MQQIKYSSISKNSLFLFTHCAFIGLILHIHICTIETLPVFNVLSLFLLLFVLIFFLKTTIKLLLSYISLDAGYVMFKLVQNCSQVFCQNECEFFKLLLKFMEFFPKERLLINVILLNKIVQLDS